MDLAHCVRLVIEQSDDSVLVLLGKIELLLNFASHRCMVGVRSCATAIGINRVDMTAHTDRNLCVKSAFPTGFPTGVMKNTIPTTEDAVRNQLLVTRIVFRLRPVHEKMVRRIK